MTIDLATTTTATTVSTAAAIATTAVATATTVVVTPFLVVTTLGVHLTAKHIQTIAHVEHGIRVDAIVARFTTAVGIHPTAEVRLLPQKVVEIEGHNEGSL